jgi:hypothetical protein
MTIEQLKEVHQTRPFQPFTVHLADGKQIYVRHNDYLARSPSGRTFVVYQDNDSFSIVDLLLVTRLEVHLASPNGQSS